MLTPLALRVTSRIRRLNRSRDFGAIVRLMSGPALKLNPRNFRSCGRATALLASFTLSLSFCVRRMGPEFLGAGIVFLQRCQVMAVVTTFAAVWGVVPLFASL